MRTRGIASEMGDFDDSMRRLLGLPVGRARAIVKRTAPAKSKSERTGPKKKKTKKRKRR